MKLRISTAVGAALGATLVAALAATGPAATAAPATAAVAAAPAPAASARVTVDWGATRATAGPLSYGLNAYSGVAPSIATDPLYAANISRMRPGLLRYHYGGLLNDSATDIRGWVDVANRRWDAARIKAVFDAQKSWAASGDYRPTVLINIPTWPEWLQTYSVKVRGKEISGLLDPDEFDAYAAFCAGLVKILNVDQRRGIKYFEVTNERDDLYYVAFRNAGAKWDRLDELIEMYRRVAVAMKKVDPGIKVGGPAFARGDLYEQVHRFVRGARNELDFLSYHFYANGDLKESDAAVYDRTKKLAEHTRDIVDIIRQESPRRPIPAWMNEYNISWGWWNNDPRMHNHKGAVFDALSMFAALDNGAVATAAWNEQDGVYGKMDAANKLRVGGNLYTVFNRYLVGKRVATTSTLPDAVVPFAVLRGKARVLALVNRTATDTAVTVKALRGSYVQYRISAEGYTVTDGVPAATLASGTYVVPENSVTVLVPESVAGAGPGARR